MKVLQINSVCGKGSTGKICVGISETLSKNSIDNKIFYFSGHSNYRLSEKISNDFYIKIQALKSRIFGNYGFNSGIVTKKLIKRIESYDPDIVHLHNIHGHDVNLEMLMAYLRDKRKKIVWTFHDCWPFTGYCTHFTLCNCNKWKIKCEKCPQTKGNTWFFDKSGNVFLRKKNAFSDLDLTIVTPSEWLAGLVKQSFLKEYPVKVINNGIDLNVFKPTSSDFRQRYGITEDKKIILGVAFGWGARKGLDVFIELAKRLPENYRIVLVGTDEKVDKLLSKNVISIHRTHNQSELAQIYTAADLFVNPTREDNYPTVNMESIACGTPVLTFRTGGSPECIDETCGSVVDCDDIDGLEREIVRICKEKPYSKTACLNHAQYYEDKKRFCECINLYKNILIN